ncbi:hypothetical protein HK105_208737 [Polyrhizophydium stewartii]|uniref:Uncharacterized protein n=1 Tax=Polyrhizophydium stewartii TaxID=2732419 RepID=A0ABR4MX21_9FUNG|nr:hypothetical protein HK105_001185 [Polyrhizophydium stewartii]
MLAASTSHAAKPPLRPAPNKAATASIAPVPVPGAAASTQGNTPVAKLFKRNTNKAKKGVNALVLASGAISAVALPSYFSFLPFSTVDVSQVRSTSAARATMVALSTGVSATRRVASMSALPTKLPAAASSTTHAIQQAEKHPSPAANNSGVNGDEDDDDFAAFAAECDKYEANLATGAQRMLAMLSASGTAAVPVPSAAPAAETPSPAQPRLPSQRNAVAGAFVSVNDSGQPSNSNEMPAKIPLDLSLHAQNRRRIQSAPTGAGGMCPPDLLDHEIGDDDEDDDMNDPRWNVDEWVVASVKSKAAQRRKRERVRTNMPVEEWDDDFDIGDDDNGDANDEGDADDAGVDGGSGQGSSRKASRSGFTIPSVVAELQARLKADIFNMQKFALHMEDLRLIFLDANDIGRGVKADHAQAYQDLTDKYASVLEQAQVMIDIADSAEDDSASASRVSPRHIQVLADMLLQPSKPEADTPAVVLKTTNQRTVSTMAIRGGVPGSTPAPPPTSRTSGSDPASCEISPELAASMRRMIANGVFVFENDLLVVLISRVPPLKREVLAFVRELRAIAIKNH